MAGQRQRRRQRAPPKKTEADEPAIRYYKESSILKPVSPSTHTDDWPCFLLVDASVHLRNGSMVSQLDVDSLGPFVVRGRLEVEVDNERYLIDRNMKTKNLWIQIDRSSAFSVGAKDDNLSIPVVWASGQAGWFEIVPSPSYQRTCDEMFQGVCLHYSLLDQYEAALAKLQKSKKKKKVTMADVPLDLDELLFQYALRSGEGLTLSEAHRRFGFQTVFLLSHFPKDTSLYHYLVKENPRVKKLLDQDPATKNARLEATLGPFVLESYDYPHRGESSSLDNSGKKRGRGRPKESPPKSMRDRKAPLDVETVQRSNTSQDPHSSMSAGRRKKSPPQIILLDDDDTVMTDPPADVNPAVELKSRNHIVDRHQQNPPTDPGPVQGINFSGGVLVGALEDVRKQMLQLIDQGKQKKQLHQFTAKSWQNKVYLECNIKNYSAVEEIFRYYARDLAQHLGPEWHDTMIYQWAKENASKPITLTLISETEVKHIVRRVKNGTRGANIEKVAEASSQGNSLPKVREYASKQTPKKHPRKVARLRPSTGGKKRLRHELDSEDNMDLDDDGSLKKRSRTSHYFTEDDNDEDGDDENGSVDEDDAGSTGQRDIHAENDAPMTQLVIRAEKLPPTQPQGPNQTWACEEPDCGYIVRDAYEEEGRSLISAHYEEHEKVAQDAAQEVALDRVNLAMKEARGHMPIKYAYFPPIQFQLGHLLEKIRTISEKSARRDEVHINGQIVPAPIKRTLLI
ncbi:hypothetical protein F4777DRAFT_594675 [Nemania sp. FL0916]|nr:hypothetical protein F4777DRAFT_594675 [Nemania sp. FL0916]